MNLVKLEKKNTSNLYYGNYLLLEKTNRVSIGGVCVPNEISNKGIITNQMSNLWMDMTSHIIPNHILATDSRMLLILGANPQKRGCITAVKKCIPIPFECIVRGYYVPTSKSWDSYRTSGHINGIPLQKGLQESEALPYPIFTPSTKEANGKHDKNISFDMMKLKMYHFIKELFSDDNVSEDYYVKFSSDLCTKIWKISIKLYEFAHNFALDKGIIIADTKFEFGLDDDLNIILIDEILTPDATRYWDADKYQVGQIQTNLSTLFIRDYINSLGWYGPEDGKLPKITQEIVDITSEIYSELYKKLFGKDITSIIAEVSMEWNYYI